MTGTSRISRWQSIVVAFSMVAALVVITPHEIARAATLTVDNSVGSGCDDGAGAPYCTINGALGDASAGDVIRVSPGTYVEDPISFSQDATIVGIGARANAVVVTSNTSGTAMLTVPSGVSVSIQNLQLSGTAGGSVGGAVLNYGNTDLSQVVISGNSAVNNGAAVSNQAGTTRLLFSLVVNNSAQSTGSAIQNVGGATLVVSNSTIASNSSTIVGSAINNGNGGTMQINNATIVGNTGISPAIAGFTGGVTISNTILANNSPSDCGAGTSGGYNLIEANAGCTTDATDKLGVDPNLGPLVNNTGSTDSYLPLTGSPAIDAGNSVGAPPGCFTNDQRGVARPQGASCDIGAVELEQAAPPASPLQDLIDASAASGGGETIVVPPGVYSESIIIGSDITLVGGGDTAADTVIDATGLAERTVTLAGNAAFENLTITGGESTSQGGNILNDSAELTLTDVVVANGTAPDGGGVFSSGILTISGSTIVGNSATSGSGGGIGGVGTIDISNSTIQGNFASSNGGGLGLVGGTASLNNVTLVGNSAGGSGAAFNAAAGTIEISNSLSANNSSDGGPNCSTLVSLGHNLLQGDPGCPLTGTDIIDAAAGNLASLANNGGRTPTRALQDGNPALDGGSTRSYPAFDANNVDDWQLNGYTTIRNGAFVLAEPAPTFTVGSAYLTNPIDVTEDFQAEFQFRIDPDPDSEGADGITFTITDSPTDLGGAGGYLGIGGSPAPVGGVSVELDTWVNGSEEGANDANALDPYNHIGVNERGSLSSVAFNTAPLADLSDGSVWTARVEYDASAATLDVYASNTGTLPATPTVSAELSLDIFSLLDDTEGYVGFTGATGSQDISGTQQVLNFDFSSGPACETADQRGVERPQGSRCDVGAYELEVTPVGTTVSGLAVSAGGDTVLESGFGVALGDIPSERLLAGASAIIGTPLGDVELDAPVDAAPLGAIGTAATPLGAIQLGAIQLGAIQLGAIQLGAIQLGAISLMDLPVDGGWEAVLAGTPLEGRPPQTVTLEELYSEVPADKLANVRLGQLDPSSSAFGDLAIGSLLLGAVPLTEFGDLALIDSCAQVSNGTCPSGASALSLELSGSSLAASPLGAIQLGAIQLGAIPLGAIGNAQAAPLGAIPLGAIQLGAIPLGAIGDLQANPLGAIPLGAIGDLAAAPLGAIQLGAIPLGAIQLGAIPLGAIQLGAIPLGAIDADGNGTNDGTEVCAYLADQSQDCSALGLDANSTVDDYLSAVRATSIASTPLGAIQLGAIPLGAIQLGAIDVQGIQLGAIQLGAIQLGAIPLGAIQLGAIPLGAIGGVAAVCATVACDANTTLAEYLAATGEPTLATTPLGAIQLGAIQLGAIQLDAIQLGAISVAGVQLGAIQLGAIDLESSPLGAIQLGAIPAGVIVDAGTGATTLAEAVQLGAIPAETQLGAIEEALVPYFLEDILDHLTVAFLAQTGGFDGLTVADVLVGLLLASDFPWEDLPLDEIEVRDIACAAIPFDIGEGDVYSSQCTGDIDTLDLSAEFLLESGDLGGLELRVTLPDGWGYLADSASVDADGSPSDLAEPTITGSDLVFDLEDVGAGTATQITIDLSVYAGYQLGSETVDVTVTGQDGPDLNATSAAITVADGLEPSSLGAPTSIDNDTLYVGYIGNTSDVDGFEIGSGGTGVRTTVFLSNLDQDVDTFIYRPESAPLSGDGSERAIPLGSTPVSDGIQFGTNSALEPEVQGDSPLAAPTGDVLADSSTNTGTNGEELNILDGPTTESYTIQVAGFQGASSDRPYTLRVKRTAEAAQPTTCSPRGYPSLSGGGATIDSDTVTLFLTNPNRFDAVYDAGSWGAASAQLAALAGRTEVGGQIVDIADIPGVAAAFGAWDADPCDVGAANDIVGAIQSWIQDNAPDSLRHVTIMGADEIVPFARAEDETVVANESTYASGFGDNPLFSALTTRHYLTDAPYGDFDPIPWVGTKYAYVTDLSVGRLVETSAHIAGAIQTYLDNDGTLSPTTAAVAGYDFLYDGASLVADRLDQQLGGAVTQRLLDDPATVTDPSAAWDRADLAALISGAPDIISANSHFDHYRALPSNENLNQTESDLFTFTDLPGSLADVIVFTMGCHSGLNVDGSIGTATESQDWPEVYSALNAIYIGNTGYGYGDSSTVALTESVMAKLAGNLDGTLTIGQALTQAKQDQFSKAGLYGVYDLKAIEEATLYGLPFWQIDVPGGGPAAPADPVAGPTGTDPISGLAAASFSIDPTFVPVNSANGTYYAVNGETEYLQWRPIQPRTGVDVTKDGLVATGAIFTDLVTTDTTIADPAFARPMTVSSTTREPEVETPGLVFPTGFTTIGTGNRVNPSPSGPAVQQVQRLNLIPGQFQGNATGSGGVQRLFEEIGGTVFYQPVANIGSIDWTRPYIADVTAQAAGGEVRFEVSASDNESGVSRVVVLVRTGQTAAEGTSIWTDVDLLESGGVWTGAATYSASVAPPLDYFVFAVNGDGVSTISVFKGGYYQAPAPAGGGGLPPVTDDVPPVISIGTPAPPSELFVETGSAVPAPFACSDALSPVTECSADVTAPDGALFEVLPGEALPAGVLGVYQADVTGIDDKSNSASAAFEYTVVGVDLSVTPELLAVNGSVAATATLLPSAVAAPDSVILDWGDSADDLTDQDFGPTLTTEPHIYTAPGVYTVTLTLSYDDLTISDSYEFVVVYDPDGGFVTGGGWIDSPAGAYAADPTLTGKANFGFVSKYKKGKSTPDGNTTFQFKAADLKFKSTSYDWMVIAGKKAQYKGSGTINGSGDYGFMITAVDAALTPSTDVDLFRIKIWAKDGSGGESGVIYDNNMNAPDSADPTTAIGGGSIVIHDGKKKK